MNNLIRVLTGNSNPEFANQIASHLNLKLMEVDIQRFNDGEIFVQIQENSRGRDVFVIQSLSNPCNDNLMELLIIIDALKRASAKSITAVIPYFGYARQDRKATPRTPISAKLVADLISTVGVDRVITMDLHAPQIQGFFDIPIDNLFAEPLMVKAILDKAIDPEQLVIVSPDIGGVVRARSLAKRLKCNIAIIDKRRPKAGESEVMNIIGEVQGKICIMVDDIVDSGGTLVNATEALLKAGALEVSAYITHGVLSGKAKERIENSKMKELVITDTINQNNNLTPEGKIKTLTASYLFASAIDRTANDESVSSLFL